MKRAKILLLFLCLITFATGQTSYFNSWYSQNPDRSFIKLLVNKDAVHQVTANQLLAAGHDFSQVQPDSIQMFYRGEEIPLTVERDMQGRFASLTFYGRRNDGAIEAQMYRNPIHGRPDSSQQPNRNFSLYSDTSAYFLTWGIQRGRRYFTTLNVNYPQYEPQASYPFERVWEPHPDSAFNSPHYAIYHVGGGSFANSFHGLNSDFVTGEGYASAKKFSVNHPWEFDFLHTPGPIEEKQKVRFKFRVFHLSNTAHHLQVHLQKYPFPLILDTLVAHRETAHTQTNPERNGMIEVFDSLSHFNFIDVREYENHLETRLEARTDLTFSALRLPTDNNSLISIKIRYQRQTDLRGKSSTNISEWERDSVSYFKFINAKGKYKVWIYDPDRHMRYEGNMAGTDANIILHGQTYGKKLELVTDLGFEKPVIASQTKFRNLCHPDSGASFVIIAHRNLRSSAQAYAAYRDTTTQDYEDLSAKVIYTDEIYEEFSYGAPTPQAIQQFVNCALDNWSIKPKYIFLWGKGNLTMRGTKDRPVVPSYGFPANDVRYTTPWGEDETSRVAIGRLNVLDDSSGFIYLENVKAFEKTGDEPWRRKGVFLGGGNTPGEHKALKAAIYNNKGWYDDPRYIGGSSIYYQKGRDAVEFFQDSIDQGVGFIFYFGHASTNFNEANLKEASEYESWGKYPFIMMLGCNAGDFTGRASFSERWMTEPGKGAIAFLANATYGYLNPLRDYSKVFFELEYGPKPRRPIGEINRLTYQRYFDSLPGVQYKNHARQMNLQGDPALVILPFGNNLNVHDPIAKSVKVYPNPAQDRLVISSAHAQIEAVKLFNLYGQVVLTQENIFKNKVQLHVSGIAAGHYFLQYKIRGGVGGEKIVIN